MSLFKSFTLCNFLNESFNISRPLRKTWTLYPPKFRSSRQKVFRKKGVFRNFAKFIGKHLCQSLFFNKAAGLRAATLLKKRLWRKCFPVNFEEFLRKPFLTELLQRLLLKIFRC